MHGASLKDRHVEEVAMRITKVALAFSLMIFAASSAFAVCAHPPKDGIYRTTNGTILGGRASEAWCSGGPGQPGNIEDAMSWDGANLGAQWHLWGMAIDAAGATETARDMDANGNGWIEYVTNYTGGQFWLSGSHLWGDGSTDYTGMVTYYTVTARITFASWQPVAATSNILMTGSFNECTNCSIQYAISNATLIWQTGYPTPMPADYPPFACGAPAGELFGVCCIVAKIYCTPIATESSTWGGIRALYR